jgi:hypothetical protein
MIFIMKSPWVGDFRDEIKILNFLQMGEIGPFTVVFATACAVYASKLLPHAQHTLANCNGMHSIH